MDSLWRQPGSYLLLMRLARPTPLAVGRFGSVELPAGWYVYAGSAQAGLGGRLRRHLGPDKPAHWHVDYLRAVTELVAVAIHVGREPLECTAAARLAERPGADRPIARFGASDCRCDGHLVRFERRPALQLDPTWSVHRVGLFRVPFLHGRQRRHGTTS